MTDPLSKAVRQFNIQILELVEKAVVLALDEVDYRGTHRQREAIVDLVVANLGMDKVRAWEEQLKAWDREDQERARVRATELLDWDEAED